jgi:PAS domain S-box-containing protein
MNDPLSSRQDLLDENIKLKKSITDLEQSVADLQKELSALRGEEALLACEKKFAALFHSSPSAIGITTFEERRFLDVNENFLEELGYKPEEVIGKKAEDLQIWVNPSQAVEFQRKLIEKGVVKNREYEFRDKGGKIHRAITSAAIITLDGQRCILTQNLDITEYKETEEELQKLASIVRHSGELVNLATPDGKMSFLNEAGCKMLGIPAHKINENNIRDAIPDHWQPLVEKDILPALLDGGSWEGELQYRNLETGELTDVYAMTFAIKNPAARMPLLFANVSRDITVQKRAIVALRESESFRRRIFESSRIPIIIMDAKTLRYIDCNPAAVEIYHFDSREETLGKTPQDVSAPMQYDNTPSAEKALFFINQARRRNGRV